MNAHFCMGEFAGISIGEKQQEACGYCGMEDAGCCHDLQQVIKIDNSQLQKTTTISLDSYLYTTLETSIIQEVYAELDKYKSLALSSPHYLGNPPVYLRNCVFRI